MNVSDLDYKRLFLDELAAVLEKIITKVMNTKSVHDSSYEGVIVNASNSNM